MFKVCIAVFLAAHFSSFDKDTKNCVISCTIYVNEKDCFTMSWGRLRMLLSTRKQVTYALNAILTALYLTSDKKKMSLDVDGQIRPPISAKNQRSSHVVFRKIGILPFLGDFRQKLGFQVKYMDFRCPRALDIPQKAP